MRTPTPKVRLAAAVIAATLLGIVVILLRTCAFGAQTYAKANVAPQNSSVCAAEITGGRMF